MTKTIAGRPAVLEVVEPAGGTTWTKRTQGSDHQAAGEFAPSLRLIQPRKQRSVEADLVTSRGRQHRHERHGERVQVPPGSSKIVARSQRSVNDEPPVPCGRTGAPRTREASPPYLLGNQQAVSHQLQEDADGGGEESDPPILLRDGSAVHMGKGRAEGQRGHRTDARGRNAPTQSVSSALSALTRKAAREPKHRFRSLYRLIDLQMLYESFRGLKRSAAPGVDDVTVTDYEENLDKNLRSLQRRLIGRARLACCSKRSGSPSCR